MNPADRSNGYERVAVEFISARSNVGADVMRKWARGLPARAAVLDLGCGHGVPVSQVLIEEGVVPFGVDASPLMVAAYRERFPGVAIECAAVEDSDFFGRTFDGVVAWGLMFLLAPDTQALVVRKVARVLRGGGTFLFTAPEQACEWVDVLTELRSVSLGAEAYRRLLAAEGLVVVAEEQDEGGNHYYRAEKTA